MPVRPDLVECWIFRVGDDGRPEYLLIQRAEDRIFPGIWQPVTGGIDAGETVTRAVLREVEEETGFAVAGIDAFYDLDQVGSFYSEDLDAIVTSVIFAIRVAATAAPRLSTEHIAYEWVDADLAAERSVWPPYRDSLELIGRLVADPDLARWFELDRDGRRVARGPG